MSREQQCCFTHTWPRAFDRFHPHLQILVQTEKACQVEKKRKSKLVSSSQTVGQNKLACLTVESMSTLGRRKLIMAVIYGFLYQARAFVPGKPLQPSLVFGGKAEAYPSEAPFRCSTVGQAPSLTHKHWKGLPGTNTSLSRKSVNYGRYKFYDTGPETEGNSSMMLHQTEKIIPGPNANLFCRAFQ